MSMNPFKDLEKKIKRGINSLGDSVKHSVEKLGNDIKHDVEQAGSQAGKRVQGLASEAERQLKSSVREIEDELEDLAEKALEEAKDLALETAQEALALISGEMLNKAVDGIQVVMPHSLSITLGPVTINVSDVKDRVDVLQKWAKNPPKGRNDLRAIIQEVAPSSVAIDLSASFAFLFVQSDSLSIGVSCEYNTQEFLDSLDDLLSHWGITI